MQNLIKKHQAVLAEINNHDGRIITVVDAGKRMMEDEHFASDEIRNRVNALYDHWVQLKEKANQVFIELSWYRILSLHIIVVVAFVPSFVGKYF